MMNIHESAEDYLETILVLNKRLGQVRSIDIVNEMEFSKPSVSVAMKKLRENGYIEMDGNLYITLTDAGREIAERIYARHRLLQKVLMAIGVGEKEAAAEACGIEHHISEETYNCINRYYNEHIAKEEAAQ